MEFQVALCKLQLLGQKWSMKSNRPTNSSFSWHSALHLALTQANSTQNDRHVSVISREHN